MRKFTQFKDFVHNNLSRNDKNEILSSSMQEAERHVDHIKNTLTGAEKKLANCLVSVPDSSSSSSTNATPERKLKKIPSSSLSNFFNEASESLATSRTDSVLSKTLLMCSQLQKDSTKVLTEYESDVEKNCIGKIQAFISEDLPAINRARKHLNKTNIELTTLRAKYDSSQKAIQSSNQLNTHQAETKLESLRKDLEDIQHKLDQCRDAYKMELLDFLSKELSISQVFYDYIKLQEAYHEQMLKKIQHYIPVLEGVLVNTQQKPVFGVSLEDHLQTSGRQISYVIAKCVDLLKNSVTEEGIFRVSGSLAKVKLLRNAFNSGHLEMVDFTSDTHAVASTLKSYLRELPEPLLTFDLYGKWVEAVAERDQQARLQSLWSVCRQLPKANYDNLCYLIKFLHLLSLNSERNKMSSQNIAIAIGPSLLWSNGPDYELSMSNYSPIIIEALITYCDYFFPEDVIFDASPKSNLAEITANSSSDHSDPETPSVSLNVKQATSRLKKPAPKPPSQSPVPPSTTAADSTNNNSHGIFDNMSSSFDATASKIRSKFGSLRGSKQKPVVDSRTAFEKTTCNDHGRVESPPVPTTLRKPATITPKPRPRPNSSYERPMVPPPEVPPRPSVTGPVIAPTPAKSPITDVDLHGDQNNINHIDSSDPSDAENEVEVRVSSPPTDDDRISVTGQSDQSSSQPPSPLYPSLEALKIEEPNYCNATLSIEPEVDKLIDLTPPPQKPPRLSLANHHNVTDGAADSKPSAPPLSQGTELNSSNHQHHTYL